MDYSPMDIIIFSGSILLFAMLLMELLDWLCLISMSNGPMNGWICQFLYGDDNGPSQWRLTFPESRGSNQSPINIVGKCATVLEPSEPLQWHNYCKEPLSMILVNDGNKVVLLGTWTSSTKPRFQGGPLLSCYDFCSVEFRWGPGEDEGSEHSIDYEHYSMEMQVVHTKSGGCNASNTNKTRIAIVSYFLQLTAVDNPYLDHVVTNLWRIRSPGTRVTVPAFPLEWLLTSFESKFYTYCGSLTQPPCTEGVTWIVNPEPIAISAGQMLEFRKIFSTEGPILTNCRPVQKLNDREIYYYA